MKPFDLEKAKAGKLVCTASGEAAEILKYDLANAAGQFLPMLVVVKATSQNVLGYVDEVRTYNLKGQYHNGVESEKDLKMCDDIVKLSLFYDKDTDNFWALRSDSVLYDKYHIKDIEVEI